MDMDMDMDGWTEGRRTKGGLSIDISVGMSIILPFMGKSKGKESPCRRCIISVGASEVRGL